MIPRNPDKPLCLLVGTCITFGIEYFLRSSEAFNARYDLQVFRTYDDNKVLDLDWIGEETVAAADAVIFHPPGWADWGNEEGYVDLLAAIPDGALQITIPYPVFTPLWPFHCHDPRNKSEGERIVPTGKPVRYSYGDSYVLSRVRKGDPKPAIMDDYLAADVGEMIDLESMFKTTFAIQMRKEADTSVKVLQFVIDSFQSVCAFNTMNHVSNATLLHMSNQVLADLDLPPLPLSILERTSLLIRPEIPIHPSLIRYFGLRYVDEDSRYQVDKVRRLTYREYLSNYIDFA